MGGKPMISPSVASMLYEKRLRELGGIFAPGAHVAALDYVAKEMGCTRADVIEALRTVWTGRG